MDLCTCDNEKDDHGVVTGVNSNLLSRYTIVNRSRRICHTGKGLVAKKNMNLCACECEGPETGVGVGVSTTLLSRYTIVNRSGRSLCITRSATP
jgi:hypothetical protein